MANDIVGQLALELGIDSSDIRRQLTRVSRDAERQLTTSFTGIGKKMAIALGTALSVKKLTSFTKECLELGSNLTEVQNVVDTSFKSMSSYVDDFAKEAMHSFGMSETVAKKYMGTIGAMNNSFGFAEQQSFNMAKAVTGLSGDVASFYNISSDEAFTKLKSIWTGETETLKELGVVMTQTALDQYAMNNGFGKTTAKMTEQEKVMLRFQYVTNALSDATGDFVKTQDSWANQTRILSLQFDSLKASLGQGFINLFTPILKGLNNLLAKLSTVAVKFKEFTEAITGQTDATGSLGNIATGALDAASGVDDLTSSAKKAQKELLGFDKITKLSDSADSGASSGVSGSTGKNMDTPVVSVKSDMSGMNNALADVKKTLQTFKEWTKKNFGPSFNKIWSDFSVNVDNFKSNLKRVFKDVKTLGKPLSAYFEGPFKNTIISSFELIGTVGNGLFDTFNRVFGDIWDKAVFPVLDKFVRDGLPMITDFATKSKELGTEIFENWKKCWDKCWDEGAGPALSLMSDAWCEFIDDLKAFWEEYGQPIFDGLSEAVTNTSDLFLSVWENNLKPVWDNFMKVADELWSKHLEPLVKNFLDFVGEFVTGASEIYNKFIVPVADFMQKLFAPAFVAVFSIIHNTVKTVIGMVLDHINGLITSLKGIVQFLTGIFTGDIDKALTGVKNMFKGVFDSLVPLVKEPINLIIGLINGMLNGFTLGVNKVVKAVNKLSIDIPGWVPKIGGKNLGFNLNEVEAPQIPYLAQGGYAKPNTPQLAVIGDNRHQGEVVAPEGKLKEMAMEAIRASQTVNNTYLVEILRTLKMILEVIKALDLDIVIDGKKLKDIIVEKINENTRKTGVCEILF